MIELESKCGNFQAGIKGGNLTVALEPEAASLYCRHLPVERNMGDKSLSLASFKPGTRYLVLDCGGEGGST